MQPLTPTKPVMDVAAPKNPAVAPNPVVPRPAPSQSTELPVRPAPLAPASAQSQAAVPAKPLAMNAQRPASKSAGRPSQSEHRAPVALITVTVFVMLVLSVLAVTIYMTSQTA